MSYKSANPLQFCGVASCRKKCSKLTPASSIALAYYGIKKDTPTVVKICPGCREKAEVFKEVTFTFKILLKLTSFCNDLNSFTCDNFIHILVHLIFK